MGEHHRVDETDAMGDAHRDEVGERRQHAGPEEDRSRDRDRQLELLEQPQREQRLDEEAAAERVEAEQRGQRVDDALAIAQRRRARSGLDGERAGNPR